MCPTLHEDKITVGVYETNIRVKKARRGIFSICRSSYSYVSGLVIDVDIPFSGDSHVFWVKPSFICPLHEEKSPPKAHIFRGDILRVYISVARADFDEKAVQNEIGAAMDFIKKHLALMQKDVDRHNRELDDLIEKRVAERRGKVLRDLDILSSLGYPIRNEDK